MPASSITVEPIAAALGAEVSGIDLSEPLTPEVEQSIREAWAVHQVLFFRDQTWNAEQHTAFARRFGEVHVHPVLPSRKDEGFPEIVVLESNEQIPFVAERWHTDVTFQKKPPLGSVLHGVIVPEAGGDTMWASMYAAYDGLSDAMQRLLSELYAVHDGSAFLAIGNDAQNEELKRDIDALHPVIRTHPVTGRKGIFVNETFTRKIQGMRSKESNAILGFLYQHLQAAEYTCRFHWRPGSVAMWDNRCTQHRVIADNLSAHRRMERVTICGDEPY